MSEVKVNKISPRTNCGTVQLGDSGDTITIPAGATITNNGTQTGFGRTGTVDWDTTAKTASFTAVSGNGYFVNTTSGAVTMTLPASPSAGDIVSFKDYANTFDTNNLTIARNGSPIGSGTTDAVISVEGQSGTLIYVDGTQGWLIVNASTDADLPRPAFVTATGGTVTTSGDFKIHTFTSPGTFCVSNAGNASGSNSVDYLVVAGGGGGAMGGGAGAGGLRFAANTFSTTCAPANPLAGASSIPVTATGFPITVGGGGGAAPDGCGADNGSSGSNSVFSTITSAGGGGGKGRGTPGCAVAGGSGGGSAAESAGDASGGAGNTPPTTPPQGNPGGGTPSPGNVNYGGGGGARTAGQAGDSPTNSGGNGGVGAGFPNALGTSGENCGSYYYFAGGGGGGKNGPGDPTGTGGLGGGGNGQINGNSPNPPSAGTANTGGGGGGGGAAGSPNGGQGAGGSGIVIIRYKFQ